MLNASPKVDRIGWLTWYDILSICAVGMVQSEQNEALRLFREGRHRIIIATSVAEEGLDVQACNFVIRYEHVTNETARIQSRGE